eukprot:maker-scaffold184_size276635-snap-gene-0.15 protein:Tk08109 transcript:maker-scaffold184_size276635-snap-gene-0.15-mRNA-1 annotation:"tyrosine-protein kinase abl"
MGAQQGKETGTRPSPGGGLLMGGPGTPLPPTPLPESLAAAKGGSRIKGLKIRSSGAPPTGAPPTGPLGGLSEPGTPHPHPPGTPEGLLKHRPLPEIPLAEQPMLMSLRESGSGGSFSLDGSLLPNKKPRKGSGSGGKRIPDFESALPLASSPTTGGGNQGQLDESQPILSTFGQRTNTISSQSSDPLSQGIVSTKSTVVQLRRNTNKKGRQAPTPPRRTSSFRDSTFTDGDVDNSADGDPNGIHRDLSTLASQEYDESEEDLEAQLQAAGVSTFSPQPQHSQQQQPFRRANNRSLDPNHRQHHPERSSRSSSKSSKLYSPKDPRSSQRTPRSKGEVHVGALDEHNLKRAVHKYGTMPKGARIGAYLESLRQSGMTPEPILEQGVDSDALMETSSCQGSDSLASRNAQLAMMMRSNSSHGGFGRATPSPRPQIMRGASAIDELELPPPPGGVALHPPRPSPRTKRKDSNKENSLPDRIREKEVLSSGSESEAHHRVVTPKSPTSPVSESAPTLGSPAVGSLSSPGSTFGDGRMRRGPSPPELSAEVPIRPFQVVCRDHGNVNPPQMGMKLADELKHFANPERPARSQEAPPVPEAPLASNPAAQLVSELSESLRSKPKGPVEPKVNHYRETHEIDFKANLRKVKAEDSAKESHRHHQETSHEVDFKSNLKKASPPSTNARDATPAPGDEAKGNIVDFKARLKKATTKTAPASPEKAAMDPSDLKAQLRRVSGPLPSDLNGKKASEEETELTPSAELAAEAEEANKRKSTGSISSLRKMWESSESASPVLGGRKKSSPSGPLPPEAAKLSPTSEAAEKTSTVKFEKRVWPPVPNTETEKPMVPVKPTMKSAPAPPTTKPPKEPGVKPPPKPSLKPSVTSNIYAAPSAVSRPAKPSVASKPALWRGGASSSSPRPSAGQESGETLLEAALSLQERLSSAKRDGPRLSTKLWTELATRVGEFHASCATHLEQGALATGRFRFRSLLNKLEEQSKELRDQTTMPPQDAPGGAPRRSQLVNDIQTTVRDLVTVIQP